MPNSQVLTGADLRIFISHKTEDGDAARAIGTHLKGCGQGRFEIFIAEDIRVGDEWREKLIDGLATADWLILLYTDPQQEWNWCLYESGFFHGRHNPQCAKRLIVLHDENVNPPDPLSSFETIRISQSDRGGVRKFITELFAAPPVPGAKPVFPELVTDEYAAVRHGLEDAIVDAVTGPQEHKVFAREIRIQIDEESLLSSKDESLPANARVFADELSFHLFGLDAADGGYSWDVFYKGMDRMSDNTADWVASLVSIMKELAFTPHRLHSTGLPLYRYSGDAVQSQVYRPAIRSYRKKKDKLSFRIVFIDLPRETTIEPAGHLSSLAQALTVARMVRWGALATLQDKLGRLKNRSPNRTDVSDEIVADFRDLLGKIETVYVEALNRGYKRDLLRDCFADDDLKELDEVYAAWDALREQIKDFLGALGNGIGSIEDAQVLVQSSLGVNKRFMVLCAKRYHEKLRDMYDA